MNLVFRILVTPLVLLLELLDWTITKFKLTKLENWLNYQQGLAMSLPYLWAFVIMPILIIIVLVLL